MADRLIQIADEFWNLRGTFRIGGVINIGTQASLVRRRNGSFVMLDAYTLRGPVLRDLMALTDDGRAIEAVLNLHPFHTVHVPKMAEQLPHARWFGTSRHVAKAPSVPWQALHTDDPRLHERFADDFDFTVPRGVDFIAKNENLHFSSVLAIHNPSRTLHVDDTLTWLSVPFFSGLVFHPTLRAVLQRRPKAADEFRAWAEALAMTCAHVDQICTAHGPELPPRTKSDQGTAGQIREALSRVTKTLDAHRARFG